MNNLKHKLKKIKDEAVHYGEYVSNFSFTKLHCEHFIVLTRERTGSTCLLDLLSSHSKIKTDPHIFYDYTKLPQSIDCKYTRSKKNILGFKFKTQPSSFDMSEQNCERARKELADLERQGVKVIYLERENLIKQAVSWLLADRNDLKKQNYKKGEKPIKIKSMEFKPEAILKRVQKIEKLTKFEKDVLSDVSFLHLKYEKNLIQENDHQPTLDKVCGFLNIEPEKAVTRYAKISSGDLSKSISNYQDVYSILKETKYSDQLHY